MHPEYTSAQLPESKCPICLESYSLNTKELDDPWSPWNYALLTYAIDLAHKESMTDTLEIVRETRHQEVLKVIHKFLEVVND